MSISSYVINLDHRKDRLSGFYENLRDVGFNVSLTRVPAVYDPEFGGLGCAKSHLAALADFLTRRVDDFCLVFEDDFRFRTSWGAVAHQISSLDKFEPGFVAYLLAGAYLVASRRFGDYCEVFECQTTSGYLVRRGYVPKLMANYSRSVLLMEKYRDTSSDIAYRRFAIDQAWKQLQQEGGWYCSTPMVGIQEESFSDIEGKTVDYSKYSA